MPDYEGLRSLLEHSAEQPDFAVIRRRRTVRTQRMAVIAASAVVAVALIATGVAAGQLRLTSQPPRPPADSPSPSVSSSPLVSSSPPPAGSPAEIIPGPVLVATASTLIAPLTQCAADCSGADPKYRTRIAASVDHGRTWQVRSEPAFLGAPGTFWFAGSGEKDLWLVTDGLVAHSADGGRGWQQRSAPKAGLDQHIAAAPGGVLWVWSGPDRFDVYDSGLTSRALTPRSVIGLIPIDRDRALIAAADDHWLRTSDRGASWVTADNPCARTRFPQPLTIDGAVAPDGSLWVTCSSGPAAGQMPKTVVVAADGVTWRPMPESESSGYATRIVGLSASTAWRYGGRARIFRTTNGTQWTDVSGPGYNEDGPWAFAAWSARDAMYVARSVVDDAMTVWLTADGGASWLSYPLTL